MKVRKAAARMRRRTKRRLEGVDAGAMLKAAKGVGGKETNEAKGGT